MRMYILMLLGLVTLTFGACSSIKEAAKNEAVKLTEKLGDSFEKDQLEEYSKAEYAGMNCEIEAAQNAADLEAKILDFLKIEKEQKKAKSLAPIVGSVCDFAATSILPKLIESSGESRPCLRKMGAAKASALGLKACELAKATL